jgi:hypothetical protein
MMFPVELADGRKFFIEMPGRGFLPTASESGTFLCPSEISLDFENVMEEADDPGFSLTGGPDLLSYHSKLQRVSCGGALPRGTR